MRRGRGFHSGFQAKGSSPSSLQGTSLTNFFPDVGFDQQSVRPGPAFPPQVGDHRAHPSSVSWTTPHPRLLAAVSHVSPWRDKPALGDFDDTVVIGL